MKFRIAYTSDLHMNHAHYRAFFGIPADAYVIGGDLTTTDCGECIGVQREFLVRHLPQFTKGKNVFLIAGNDDCAINTGILQNSRDYHFVHNRRIRLNDDFEIVGYSFVNPTPFPLKDWEKPDLPEVGKNPNAGVKSTANGFVEFKLENKGDCIQRDLSSELFTTNASNTVYVMHASPYDTCLDMSIKKIHLGSRAIREFIEKNQPYLTLHGHNHATVHASGEFVQKIGKTTSMAAGNNHEFPELAALVFDLYEPEKAERMKINASKYSSK